MRHIRGQLDLTAGIKCPVAVAEPCLARPNETCATSACGLCVRRTLAGQPALPAVVGIGIEIHLAPRFGGAVAVIKRADAHRDLTLVASPTASRGCLRNRARAAAWIAAAVVWIGRIDADPGALFLPFQATPAQGF